MARLYHRWTARHPDADPNAAPGSAADWGPDVGCIAYEATDALLLVDPLVPEDRGDLEGELDALVRRHGRRVAIVTTLQFHRRSRERLAERYVASTSRARTTDLSTRGEMPTSWNVQVPDPGDRPVTE